MFYMAVSWPIRRPLSTLNLVELRLYSCCRSELETVHDGSLSETASDECRGRCEGTVRSSSCVIAFYVSLPGIVSSLPSFSPAVPTRSSCQQLCPMSPSSLHVCQYRTTTATINHLKTQAPYPSSLPQNQTSPNPSLKSHTTPP